MVTETYSTKIYIENMLRLCSILGSFMVYTRFQTKFVYSIRVTKRIYKEHCLYVNFNHALNNCLKFRVVVIFH